MVTNAEYKEKTMKQSDIKISKFLSYVLRHQPGAIGLNLDENGWASIDEFIQKAGVHGNYFTRAEIDHVVLTNDKKRFAFSSDGTKIRACQGHSITVDLELTPETPPLYLYHGTAQAHIESIFSMGIKPKNRMHVHLSLDYKTAVNVGRRHGSPVVLKIFSGKMAKAGHLFFLSDNGVWLTDFVGTEFFMIDERSDL